MERLHGAHARGVQFHNTNGTPKRAPVTVPLTLNAGDILMAEGKLDKGLACYRRVLDNAATICKQGNGNDATNQELVDAIMKIGTSAIWFILDRRFDVALECADEALSCFGNPPPDTAASGKVWLHMHRAFALMFLDRVNEARQV